MIRTLYAAFALAACLAAQPLAQSPQSKADTQAKAAKPAMMVNLNSASITNLQDLPGIGARTAARIIEYREKKGPFKKIEELMNVQGVGEKSFLKLRSQITVGAKAEPANQQP